MTDYRNTLAIAVAILFGLCPMAYCEMKGDAEREATQRACIAAGYQVNTYGSCTVEVQE